MNHRAGELRSAARHGAAAASWARLAVEYGVIAKACPFSAAMLKRMALDAIVQSLVHAAHMLCFAGTSPHRRRQRDHRRVRMARKKRKGWA